MKAKMVFGATLLFLINKSTFQQFAGCRESYYLYKGSCIPCPDRCAACNSELNCTECNGNYYGPVCQHTCQQDCKDLCHKVHGYCTYGCSDGLFPEPNSPLCASCPPRCRKCKSMTECIECIPGYHGNTCENRCFSYCEKCNKTTGACLVCDEKFFNQDGQCRRCPDGCESCYDSKNCSRCKEGFINLTDGQCIMECAMGITDAALNMSVLEYIRTDECMSTIESQYFEVKIKKPCIQFTSCSSNIMCSSEYDGNSGCGTIKSYQCNHVCHLKNEKEYTFEHNCTIKEQDNSVITLCVANRKAFSVMKLSTDSECINVSEDQNMATPQSWMAPMWFLITQSVALVCVLLLLVLMIIRYRRRLALKEVNDKEPVEDEVMAMVCKKCEEPTAETDLNRPLQVDLEIEHLA